MYASEATKAQCGTLFGKQTDILPLRRRQFLFKLQHTVCLRRAVLEDVVVSVGIQDFYNGPQRTATMTQRETILNRWFIVWFCANLCCLLLPLVLSFHLKLKTGENKWVV